MAAAQALSSIFTTVDEQAREQLTSRLVGRHLFDAQ
jgi:hypothetical protein